MGKTPRTPHPQPETMAEGDVSACFDAGNGFNNKLKDALSGLVKANNDRKSPALVYGLPAVGAYGAYGTYGLPVYVPTVKTVSEPCKNEAGEAVPCAKGDPDAKLKYHV